MENTRKDPAAIPEIRFLEKFSHVLDSSFTLPGTKFKFGLDPIIGLIPVAGPLTTFVASSILVLAMARHGASGSVITRMVLNVVVDSVISSIPILGNIFDFFLKANDRNLSLLKKHYGEGKYQGSGKGILWGVFIALLVFGFLVIYGMWKLGEWVWNLF